MENILFQTRHFLSMRAGHQHPTQWLLAPITCLQVVQSLPHLTANSQLLASEAGSSVHCGLLFGARKVGMLHWCASLIDSWHRKGDVLMKERQLPTPDSSTGIREVAGERAGSKLGWQ